MSDFATISRRIWSDPEFTGLTYQAQLLYFLRKTTKQRTVFDPEEAAVMCGFASVQDVESAAALLKQSKYGYVLAKKTVRGEIPLALRREVFAHDGWMCVYCQSKRRLEIDHIIPISKGGTDDRHNLQTLCRTCNRKKGAN
jgi:hypothetical protein